MNAPHKRYWLDDPRNVTLVFRGLIAVCALAALSELPFDKHVEFPWERWFNWHGFYGFVCCFFLVLAAKQLRRVLLRPEDYYD
jgi:hypothetical protein